MNDALDQRPKDVNSLEEMRHGRLRGGQERQLRVERAQEFLRVNDIDDTVHVSDLECIAGCRRLVRREGILAGASSGGLVAAVVKLRDRIPAGATCVVILPDRGERYLDTVYSDEWVRSHFGQVGDLWPEKETVL